MSIKSKQIPSVPSVQVHVAGRGTRLDDAIDNATNDLERVSSRFTENEQQHSVNIEMREGGTSSSGVGSDQPISKEKSSSGDSLSRIDETEHHKIRSSEYYSIIWAAALRFLPSTKIHFFVLGFACFLLCFHVIISLTGEGAYEEDSCLSFANIELNNFLASTLIEVCDCVPKGSQAVFYNPAMTAVSAMLAPNLLRVILLIFKYTKFYIQKFMQWEEETGGVAAVQAAADESIAKVTIAIDVLSFVLNTVVGLHSIVGYFTSPELAPYGDSLCHATHITFAVMYKPVLFSFFGAMVAGCDVVYWRSIDAKPPAVRRSMGHKDHPEKSPLDENYITFSCMLAVAVVYAAWASVSLTFLPLALLFVPIVFVFGVGLPFVLLYTVGDLLESLEAFLDDNINAHSKGGSKGGGGQTSGRKNKVKLAPVSGESRSMVEVDLDEEESESGSEVEVDPDEEESESGSEDEVRDNKVENANVYKRPELDGPVKEKVKKGFIVKAILAQLVSTIVLVATTASFYSDGDWPSSVENAVALARALKYDFSFDLEYTFGWPVLPGFAMINFSVAIGVLALQFIVTNFVRLYFSTGANVFGTDKIQKQGGEKESGLIALLIVHTYFVLNSALATAIAVDSFVLKREAVKRFKKARSDYGRKVYEAPTELSDDAEELKKDINEMNENISHERARLKGAREKLKLAESSLNEKEIQFSARNKTKSDLNRVFFVDQLEFSLVSKRRDSMIIGDISDLSFSANESFVRDGIANILLNEPHADTNSLIHALFSNKSLPNLTNLHLGSLVDIETIDRSAFSALIKAQGLNPKLVITADTKLPRFDPPVLPNLDDEVTIAKASWAAANEVDISGMETWVNVQQVILDGCEFFHGDIKVLDSLSRGILKVLSCKDCKNIFGSIDVLKKHFNLEKANFSGCKKITGDIAVLGNLTKAMSISMAATKVTGDIDEALRKLVNLESANFYDCRNITGTFTGTIVRLISDIRTKHGKEAVRLEGCGRFVLAENLSDIADISYVDLSGISSLEGSFEAAFSGLSSIKEIGVGGTRVDCKRVLDLLPSMPWAAQLKKLDLARTNAEGDIAMFSNLTKATSINMVNTSVAGSFEAAFSGLSSIEEIDVGHTKVDCKRVLDLLPSMSWAAQLKKLGLAYTNTEGDIAVLGNLTKATSISMSATKVTGDIAVLGKCPGLVNADFSHCREISGDIAVLGNLTKATSISMAATKITGSFDAAFSGLSSIEEIDVGHTKVDCKRVLELLPSMPWAAQLKKLGLAFTNTEGDIKVFEHTKGLNKLNMAKCEEITGDIAVFSNLTEATFIGMMGTKVTGDIGVLANCPGLKIAEFRDCSVITGDIGVLANCPGLQTVNFTSCEKITGDIKVFEHTKGLKELSISGHNIMSSQITGDIAVLGKCPGLVNAAFRHCRKITGDIGVFANCPGLQSAGFAFCQKIAGDIAVLGNLTKATEINMPRTDVSGDIAVLGKCPGLVNANFSNCRKITGDIKVFEHTKSLTELNMAECGKITGDIAVLGKCPGLVNANFSYCDKITGDIKVFEQTKQLETLSTEGCEELSGDKEAIKKTLPDCNFYF